MATQKKKENKNIKINNGEKTLTVTEKAFRVVYKDKGYVKGEAKAEVKAEAPKEDDK